MFQWCYVASTAIDITGLVIVVVYGIFAIIPVIALCLAGLAIYAIGTVLELKDY